MNWIGKLVIVVTCAVALALPSSPAVARSARLDQSSSASLQKIKDDLRGSQKETSFKKKARAVTKTKGSTGRKKITKRSIRRSTVASSTKAKDVRAKVAVKKRSSARTKETKRTTTVIVRSSKSTRTARVRRSAPLSHATVRPVVVVGSSVATGASAPRITARSAMIMDAVTGGAIYAQASDTPAQPASTIKVLTGVISLDTLPKNELVPVSKRAAMMPRSKVYLRPGKKYPANDLINAVLLASANDASVALAERIAGSEQAFARMMTAKARSYGATNTVCKTANGLTASGQFTTARDLAKIFNNAMRNSEFANKMAVTEVINTDGKVIKSHNRALWQVDGAEGGKTGYTDVARKTYVGKFKRDNDEIIVSLMGSESMWEDIKRLVEYGFAKKRKERASTASARDIAASPRLAVQLPSQSRQISQVPTL